MSIHLAYVSGRIRCHFFTLIVRNQALEEKYPGGLKAFLEKNSRAFCNDEISAEAAMGWDDLGSTVEDITQYGLEKKTDWIVIDAAGEMMDLVMSRQFNWECRIELGVEWLDWKFDPGTGQFTVGYVKECSR